MASPSRLVRPPQAAACLVRTPLQTSGQRGLSHPWPLRLPCKHRQTLHVSVQRGKPAGRNQWVGARRPSRVVAAAASPDNGTPEPATKEAEGLYKAMEQHAKLLAKEQEELKEADVYLERAASHTDWIKRSLAKKYGWTGYLKNTPYNPAKQGKDITYAQFRDLLDQQKVQYMEYDEWGKDISVILPHYVPKPVNEGQPAAAEFVVEYHKHKVKAMPNENWEELWHKLRPQVVDMRVNENVKPPPDAVVWRQGVMVGASFLVLAGLYWAGDLLLPGIVELWDTWRIQRDRDRNAAQDAKKAEQEAKLKKVLTEEQFAEWQRRIAEQERAARDLQREEIEKIEDWKDKAWASMQERDRKKRERKERLEKDKEVKERKEFSILNILGESRARMVTGTKSTGVTFADVAGLEYVKRELKEVVEILKDDKKYSEIGVYCPKGVLLHGPPGTGKTLMAKAVAGEAGVPFLSTAGSEFVEMFQGVAASRVRDLFRRARQLAPCIIFIDEIDAIGIARGAKGSGGEEREQALTQMLVEMDGFKATDDRVLIMGATNRKDLLDPALLRKGRFDKVYAIMNPNKRARMAILQVHARTKSWKSDAERDRLLEKLTELTPNYSGAQLQNVLNEASILTVRKDKDYIELEEIMEVYQKLTEGIEVEREVDEIGDSTLRVAYREAAVALIYTILPDPKQKVEKVSLEVDGPYPEVKFEQNIEYPYTVKTELIDMIVRGYSIRCAEEVVFGRENVTPQSQPWVNASASLAEAMVLQYGWTALGITHYETRGEILPNVTPKVVALREEYTRYAYEKCTALLQEYRPALEQIVNALYKKDLSGDEVKAIVDSAPRIAQPPVPPPNEYEALMYAGRWGIHGVSLPGRATFSPGNLGYATFGAPRPRQVRVLDDEMVEILNRNERESSIADRQEQTRDLEERRRRDVETPMEVLALT